jgi:predicted transcriptional regulator of viral defense system
MSISSFDLVDRFLSRGKHAFTPDEAAAALGTSRGAALDALERLQERDAVFTPAKGLYVAVPAEYRSWGVVPGAWFIDAMMGFLGRPYYVGFLSAAELHGASHQAPQLFQVVVDNANNVKARDLGRVRLRFYSSTTIGDDSVEKIPEPTGYVTVSTKETTVVDLVNHPRFADGLSNVATIVKEIGQLNGAELARVASRRSLAATRRVGWMVENFGDVDELEAVRQAARIDEGEPSLLIASGRKRGTKDKAWSLRLNGTVEPDL